MLFSKTALIASFLAFGNIVFAADAPACLISAVGSEPNPADLKAICVTNGDDMQTKIRDLCGDNADSALQSFASTCADGGHKITIKTPTTTSSGSSTSTTGSGSNQTGSITTGTSTGATATGSNSTPSPTETPSSGSSDRQVSAAAFAAVVFVGFAATL